MIRIRDTTRQAGSKTLATTVVLVDRALGLMALVLVAGVWRDACGGCRTAWRPADRARVAVGGVSRRCGRYRTGGAGAGRLRPAAAAAAGLPSRVGRRPHRKADRRAVAVPGASHRAGRLLRRRGRSSRRPPCSSTCVVAYALHLDIGPGISPSSCRCRSSCSCCRCRSTASASAKRSSRCYFPRIGLPIELGAPRLRSCRRAADAVFALRPAVYSLAAAASDPPIRQLAETPRFRRAACDRPRMRPQVRSVDTS